MLRDRSLHTPVVGVLQLSPELWLFLGGSGTGPAAPNAAAGSMLDVPVANTALQPGRTAPALPANAQATALLEKRSSGQSGTSRL